MIAYRQRGFVNVYAFIATGVSVGLLLFYAQLIRFLPHIALSSSVNLLAYCLAVVVGMTASMGHVRQRGYTLHILGWFGGIALAFRQVLFVAACIFTLMFVTKDREISRLFLGSYLVILGGVLTVCHAKFPPILVRVLFGENAQSPTLFIGRGGDMEDLDDWISNRGYLGIRPVGFLSEEKPTRAQRAIAPYLGRIDNLEAAIKEHQVRQVVLLEWMTDSRMAERIVELCEQEGCRFLIHNNLDARFARPLIPVQEGGRHFLALQDEPLEDPFNRLAKRSLDIAISLPVVVFIIPPLCVWVWLMQRWQAPGPVFFVRPRGGKNRQEFKMFKFRSMYSAEHDINRQATSADGRIYSFGKFLRRSSLDEFPQFINVLNGSMSVVGPRPHLPQHDADFSLINRAYRVRSLVKPGITGLAQINGFRGEITEPEKLHQRVYWDLYYVTNWSVWMDVQIIIKTAVHVLFPPSSAY
ncbi:MAG TPA: exopolysaccharide biosynthesis polyprenyl glycosylphosphotransferase [Rariglobus sp.]|jgi:exopolysaccharide biosynthesis polyprenyl glycosylphosphotransferase|nr:exopolysaccharide biosynthesis polyprenyl glycosylphosphotransferase [Rariglobus sp.]